MDETMAPSSGEMNESEFDSEAEFLDQDYEGRTTDQLKLVERLQIVERAERHVQKLVDDGIVHYEDEAPLNVYAVIEKLGLSVEEGPLHQSHVRIGGREIAGAIIKKPGEDHPYILLEKSGSSQHKLFTASHELGHYLAWCEKVPAAERKEVYWGDIRPEHAADRHGGDRIPSEYAANTFAQFLLMPAGLVISELQKGKNVDQIAQRFGVTHESAVRRLSYFDIASQTYD